MKPMRGVAPKQELTKFPYLASPKIDGIRALVRDGVVLSETLKPIPNRRVQELFGEFHGYDGELVVGLPYKEHDGDNVYARTRGPVMARDAVADFKFYVFDRWDMFVAPAWKRVSHYFDSHPGVIAVEHTVVNDANYLATLEEHFLDLGFEGVMLRQNTALYKYGTSTERDGSLLKILRLQDSGEG